VKRNRKPFNEISPKKEREIVKKNLKLSSNEKLKVFSKFLGGGFSYVLNVLRASGSNTVNGFLVVFGCFWVFLGVFGCFWVFFGCFLGVFWVVFGRFGFLGVFTSVSVDSFICSQQ
jgi:hypothetical protein